MVKKVAVLVRDRQHEALRMSVGLTLEDNAVSIFVMDRKLPFFSELSKTKGVSVSFCAHSAKGLWSRHGRNSSGSCQWQPV